MFVYEQNAPKYIPIVLLNHLSCEAGGPATGKRYLTDTVIFCYMLILSKILNLIRDFVYLIVGKGNFV